MSRLRVLTAAELADLIPDDPPTVSAARVGHRGPGNSSSGPACLLAWGLWAPGRWAAGISVAHRAPTPAGQRGLLTMWVPAELVQQYPSGGYGQVPRTALVGGVEAWPVLPPRYRHVTAEWVALHRHVLRPDSSGRYREVWP